MLADCLARLTRNIYQYLVQVHGCSPSLQYYPSEQKQWTQYNGVSANNIVCVLCANLPRNISSYNTNVQISSENDCTLNVNIHYIIFRHVAIHGQDIIK